jgi:branched-chain amino acid transport system permease protein
VRGSATGPAICWAGAGAGLGLAAPWFIYPTFLMKVLCFALFACAFNLLLGYAGLLSFGHAAFFGGSAYVCAGLAKNLGLTPGARPSWAAPRWPRRWARCSAGCPSAARAST